MQWTVQPVATWLREIDPGAERRLKGLRLVAAYSIAIALGRLWDFVVGTSGAAPVANLAAGFALWGSVSEARTERVAAGRDLLFLCAAAALGALLYSLLVPLVRHWAGSESILLTGAFLVAYLKSFGTLGAGIGSQLYIGELLAFGVGAQPSRSIFAAGIIAMLAAILPRWLIRRAHRANSGESPMNASLPPSPRVALLNGIQTTGAALVVVVLNNLFVLTESAWAITACVYIITATRAETIKRARHRIIGTLVGVPIGLACMPIAVRAPLLTWILAAVAMVVYTVSLPRRYDCACGAFAFTLVVTLEMSGQHSADVLLARVWETMLGAALGVAMALLIERASAALFPGFAAARERTRS
jgi:Fusaric acid resistance protein-like